MQMKWNQLAEYPFVLPFFLGGVINKFSWNECSLIVYLMTITENDLNSVADSLAKSSN